MAEAQTASLQGEPSVPDLTGTMVGRFAIRARLGAGGMGEVYRAEDTRLKRFVALKRISPRLRADAQYRQRFLREAERASALNHHAIAGVYDVLEEREETFLVMEYVEGATLRDRLNAPFETQQFLPIALQCAEALQAAHEKGIVHRDIKPENIMVTPKGKVKVLDFGVAKRLPHPGESSGAASTASDAGQLSGTPAYMAPEVLLEKEPDGRADLFSLGVVFYEMLAGVHPFRAESFMATSDHILHAEPIRLDRARPQIPARLAHLVGKMLAKEPAHRPASAAPVLAELQAIERSETPPEKPWFLHLKARQRIILGLLLLLVAAVAELAPLARRTIMQRWPGLLASVPEKKNLAVLPFQVFGGGAETAAFANGLTETLNARLTRITERHPLQVVPAGEVRAQKISTLDAARREFGVNLVIEGSLQQVGEIVRVSYALVDTRSRRQLRADVITAAMADPFAVEDRVVASVVDKLEVELQPAERRALTDHGTREPAAYDLYLRGRGYLQEYHKPENIESAIEVFQRALAQDPRYALAYAGLGEAFWRRYEDSREAAWVGKARGACERAVALDDSMAGGHNCLGMVFNATGRHELAVAQFRRALQLEPTSDAAYRGLGLAYEQLGNLPQAEQTYRQAIAFRPEYWAGYNWLGNFYFHSGRNEDAIAMFQKVTLLAPENSRGFYNLGGMQIQAGHWPEAEQSLKQSLALRETGAAYSNLGTIYFYERRSAEAIQAFEAAVKASPKEEYTWGNLADAYRWSPGESPRALATYQQATALAEEELRVNPRRADVLANLALYRAKTGKPAAAVRTIEQALRLTPQDPTVLYSAAVVHHLAGSTNAALDWLNKAVERGYPRQQVQADPEFHDLQNNPQFLRLARTLAQKGS